MLKIYISLPITGQERQAQEKADLVKAALSRKGYKPVSPFDIFAGKEAKYEDHICQDLRIMLDCDAIYFCEGWEKSCGCNVEYNTAMTFKSYGKKDFKIMFEV